MSIYKLLLSLFYTCLIHYSFPLINYLSRGIFYKTRSSKAKETVAWSCKKYMNIKKGLKLKFSHRPFGWNNINLSILYIR